ncbi:MAG: TetR/AcrR family transcriptional regulator C-terminal domain-containing protein [Polyangiaceae bacterium]
MPPAPPYQRIVLALRRRIDNGELPAGARLPSTRELAREWGVALATAAHALRELAAQGLVHTAPRQGTVVASSGGKAAAAVELSTERIVASAIALADAEGISAVSLRAVAARLGAPVMSLYRHVPSKEALLRAMVDSVLGEERLPRHAPLSWRAQLETCARSQWRTLRRHPWAARQVSITRPHPLPNAIEYAEWVLRALEGHGLDAATRMRLHILLYGFIQGIAVNLETEAEAAGETGLSDDAWMSTQLDAFDALAKSGRYPAFGRLLGEFHAGFELDFDVLFEQGLGLVLDGFAQVIARAQKRR